MGPLHGHLGWAVGVSLSSGRPKPPAPQWLFWIDDALHAVRCVPRLWRRLPIVLFTSEYSQEFSTKKNVQ